MVSDSLCFDRLLRRRRLALARHLARALEGDAVAVHQARVASRRLRELLPLAVPSGAPHVVADARRALRRLTRALGPVRELDVALTSLGSWQSRGFVSARVHAKLAGELARERSARRDTLAHRMRGARPKRLLAALDELGASIREDGAARMWLGVLALRLDRRAADVREATRAAGALYSASGLHDVRIAVKKLRYAVELAAETRAVTRLGRALTTLKRAQDTLGELHDVDVLAAIVGRSILRRDGRGHAPSPGPRAGAPTPAPGIRRLVQQLDLEARRLHADYLATRSGIEAVADMVTDRVVPALSAAALAPSAALVPASARRAGSCRV